ncbi:hypothetical protein BDN70DRAFT_898696 [Pholiota conissans]|uniref:Uncharacterized protein n=1 Tax=Pholiota conissans TaxID=109636 RepID=A0A9P6CWN7_9AGAR|nr:hypothetical protein BDN70DRAFT_898696 [Pholiota conissans]
MPQTTTLRLRRMPSRYTENNAEHSKINQPKILGSTSSSSSELSSGTSTRTVSPLPIHTFKEGASTSKVFHIINQTMPFHGLGLREGIIFVDLRRRAELGVAMLITKFLKPQKGGNADERIMTINGVSYIWSYNAESKVYAMVERPKANSLATICSIALRIRISLGVGVLEAAKLTIYDYPKYQKLYAAIAICAVIFCNDHQKYTRP